MTTILTRTLTLSALFSFSAAAFAQSGPALYPSFIPTANSVTATGQMNYDVQVPNASDSCQVPINDSLLMTDPAHLSVSAATSCSASAVSPIIINPEGCDYFGSAEVTPQATGSGTGFGYEVEGTSSTLQVLARSKHFLSAEAHTVGIGPGPTNGTSTADFSISAPAVISVPFGIAHNGSAVVVNAGDAVLSRQAGTLSGSSEMSWRIVQDQNRNGLIDPNENNVILAGGTGVVGGGIASNGSLLAATINRGLYVLEVTFSTEAGAEATAFCNGSPMADIQAGVESVSTRLNVDFL